MGSLKTQIHTKIESLQYQIQPNPQFAGFEKYFYSKLKIEKLKTKSIRGACTICF